MLGGSTSTGRVEAGWPRCHYYSRRVVRRLPLRAIAGVATALTLGLATLTPAAAVSAGGSATQADGSLSVEAPGKDAEYDPPLEVTIDGLNPGAVPRSGPILITGTVTNLDLEEWRVIKLYPFTNGGDCAGCPPIMRTAAEVELAAKSDPDAPTGNRVTSVEDEIPALGPGESATYTLRIPQPTLRELFPRTATGIYWFGVHALGQSDTSERDTVADGRARTFLPSVRPADARPVDTSVVIPLRAPIAHAGDGSLARAPQWQAALAPDGILGGPLAFGSASGDARVTWLVDPAVPDAVRQLALGNPPREFEVVTPDEPGDEQSDPSDGTGDDADGDDDASDDATDDPPAVDPSDPLANAALSWLNQARRVLADGTDDALSLLPYGDPDLSAVGAALPRLYTEARQQPSAVLAEWGAVGVPTVASPSGYLSAKALAATSDDATVLLTDEAFGVKSFPDGAPDGGLIGERPVVTTSSNAAAGGPGPDPATAPVALRQRILTEAVLRLLTAGAAGPTPLVVVLPAASGARGAREFWSGLDLSWIRLTGIGSQSIPAGVTHHGRTPAERQVDPQALSYPRVQRRAEVPTGLLSDDHQVIRLAQTLQDILGEDVLIASQLIDEALAATSYSLRDDGSTRTRLAGLRDWVEGQLGEVTLDAPSGATLSSSSGSFNVSVRNSLDHPVTVQIQATTDRGATIKADNPIVLAARSRASIPVSADMTQPGVHNVTLRLTDSRGVPLGAEDDLPIRSGQAGVVIWAIMGVGAGILFLAIAIRLFRRFRRHREAAAATQGSP